MFREKWYGFNIDQRDYKDIDGKQILFQTHLKREIQACKVSFSDICPSMTICHQDEGF
jgi:hypothetical protein